MEETIRRYFKAWVDNDITCIQDIFSKDVIYTECYGPEYHGREQIIQWFSDWNKHGRVLEWTIHRVIQQGNTLVVQWYFECDYENNVDGFDGVTIADFDDNMQIKTLSEFQSKAEHVFPYGE